MGDNDVWVHNCNVPKAAKAKKAIKAEISTSNIIGGSRPGTRGFADQNRRRSLRVSRKVNQDGRRTETFYIGSQKRTGLTFNPSAYRRVTIKYTGARSSDFAQANAITGQAQPAGYVWHHLHDYDPGTNMGTMILVPNARHAVNHSGGVAQWKFHNGVEYGP